MYRRVNFSAAHGREIYDIIGVSYYTNIYMRHTLAVYDAYFNIWMRDGTAVNRLHVAEMSQRRQLIIGVHTCELIGIENVNCSDADTDVQVQ